MSRAKSPPTPVKKLGRLYVLNTLPFAPQRLFWIDAPAGAQRGGHAHRVCRQLIVPISGDVRLRRTWFARGAWRSHTAHLVPRKSWLVEPLMWVDLTFLTDGVVAVLASAPYDAADYVTDKRTLRELSR